MKPLISRTLRTKSAVSCTSVTRLNTLDKGNTPVHIATVPEDLTHLQTVQLMADLMRNADGDVAVVSDGGAVNEVLNTNGVSGRLCR